MSSSDVSDSGCSFWSACSADSSGSSMLEANKKNQQAWASEYRGKINEYHGTIDSFINVLIPASEAVCPPMDCSRKFDKVPEDRPELLMYNPLVNGFLALTEDFPMAKSLRFHDNSNHMIPFPYMSWDLHHHRTKPDLITSYPGTTTSLKDPHWKDVALAIEVKPERSDDPIGRWAEDGDNTMRQLVKNGRNLLVGHSGLFAFVFGIFGHEARIFRFNYVERPELFRQFFWNFVNPLCDTRISGDDPTVDTKITRSHLRWVEDVLEPEDVQGSDAEMHRWISADAVTKEGETVKMNFLTVKLLFINPCLFSRSTTVWSAIDKDDISGKQYVIKDSWRQGLRESEMTYCSHIMKTLRDRNEEPFGLAVLRAGADLGDLEDKERMKLDDQIREPLVPGNAPRRSLLHPSRWEGHRTLSAFVRNPKYAEKNDSRHIRLIQETLGIPLSNFRRTKRMVEALCDAIKGHRQAYSTGVLHRDVSEGNVYMIDDMPYKGFIGNFDYSSFLPGVRDGHDDPTRPDADPNDSLKERTGTYAFMAVELLNKRRVIHDAHHDLESFYWLLIWLVLRHTSHDDPKGAKRCSLLFFHDDDILCGEVKRAWLCRDQYLGVPGNAPLTWLLKELTILCDDCQCRRNGPTVHLTYKAVLEKFETALSLDGWPEDDCAIPFKPYVETEEVGHADPANAAIAAAIAAANQAGESTKARSRKASIKIQATALNKSSKRKYEPEPQVVQQGVQQGGAELRRSKRARSKRVMSMGSARMSGYS
ncbi:hypothetical protein BKA93DRAFT_878241 [Sparassis latifolia]